MKATEQYFPVVLFIMLYKVVYVLCLWMKSYSVTIQMKATERYFPVVLFIMLYKVVLAFQPVDEIQSVTSLKKRKLLTRRHVFLCIHFFLSVFFKCPQVCQNCNLALLEEKEGFDNSSCLYDLHVLWQASAVSRSHA